MPGTEKQAAQVPAEVMTHYAPPTPQVAPQVPSSNVVIPAIFPMPMFPVISQPSPQMTHEEPKGERREERDELVEAIAALAILRILTQGT